MDNTNFRKRLRDDEKGVQLLEYAIGVAILVIVFIVASKVLNQSAHDRVDNSIKVIEGMAPCGGKGGLLNSESGSLECM